MTGAIACGAHREHDRHFHKHADHGCQGRAGFRSKQRNRRRDGKLKTNSMHR